MIIVISVSFICIIFVNSLRWIWTTARDPNQSLTLKNFLLLLMTYAILFMGFGAIYALLHFHGIQVLSENGTELDGSAFEQLLTSMYFSAITMLSVGYGDISPVGIGRWLAMIEALLGYALPTALVVRTVIDFEKNL